MDGSQEMLRKDSNGSMNLEFLIAPRFSAAGAHSKFQCSFHYSFQRSARLLASFIFFLPLLSLQLAAGFAAADDFSLGGQIKYERQSSIYESGDLGAELGPDVTFDGSFELRLVSQGSAKKDSLPSLDFGLDLETLSVSGTGIEARRSVLAALPIGGRDSLFGSDKTQVLDLELSLLDEKDAEAVMRLDRIWLGLSGENAVLRIGRQAVTWGNGILFAAFDLFNPFSPTENDSDYKSGDDMIYAQLTLPTGGDVQALIVPRRSSVPENGSLEAKESSFALKWREYVSLMELDLDILLARHYDENIYGIGLSRTLFDGILRSDLIFSELVSGENIVTALLNYDRSWVVFQRNLYAFVEYFRSGTGVTQYESIDSDLSERIRRGELYTLGRDYLGIGGRFELGPLWQLAGSAVINLHDESGAVQQLIDYEVTEDILISLGSSFAYGPRGSEFGGLKFAPGSAYAAVGDLVYLRFKYFF